MLSICLLLHLNICPMFAINVICMDKLKNQAFWKRLPKITISYFKRLHRIISMVIFSIDNKVRLTTKHYSKQDYFNLPMVNFIQLHLHVEYLQVNTPFQTSSLSSRCPWYSTHVNNKLRNERIHSFKSEVKTIRKFYFDIKTLLTVKECLYDRWPQIYFVCCSHDPVILLSLNMTNPRIIKT